ncbi:MAG: hypothetical protein JWP98_602 [Edaphobacter sp.]|nr:hypothetical protein [Edaphobacter sp.]
MRTKLFALVTLVAASILAHADTITYGPVTFGSNAPFGSDGYVSQYSLLPMYAPGIRLNDPVKGTDDSFTQTIAFYFDLAPGWRITNMRFTDLTDWSPIPYNLDDSSQYAYEYEQKITLCSASGTCSSASTSEHMGSFPLPPISLDAQAGSNVGIYQVAGYSHNAQVATKPAESNLNIFLVPIASIPEPETFVLLGTGILGLAGVFMRKRSQIHS